MVYQCTTLTVALKYTPKSFYCFFYIDLFYWRIPCYYVTIWMKINQSIKSTWGNSIHLLVTQYNFASEYSQNLELCNLEDYLGLVWSYFLCTGYTMGMDKLTVCLHELLNSLVGCILLSPAHMCSFSVPSLLFYTSPVSNLCLPPPPPQVR